MLIRGMEWAEPENSISQVKKAGKILVSPSPLWEDFEEALDIINNWRASHQYPLNIFTDGLRKRSRIIDNNRIVAQRIKRLSSIDLKLRLKNTMKLNQMQDIGGCRAIVTTSTNVYELLALYKKSSIKHKLKHIDDYISNPKLSGYRGIHLIYSFYSDKQKPSVYNGHHIEMQIRSRQQHAWATAVETMGLIIGESLKSGQGNEDWLRFFSLMSSVIAMREKSVFVPETPTNKNELLAELKYYENKLNAAHTLMMYNHALNVTGEKMEAGQYHFVLKLEPDNKSMTISSFQKRNAEQAKNFLIRLETEAETQTIGEKADIVLVSADSIKSLKKAYPNYFMDTAFFVNMLRQAIK